MTTERKSHQHKHQNQPNTYFVQEGIDLECQRIAIQDRLVTAMMGGVLLVQKYARSLEILCYDTYIGIAHTNKGTV